MFNVKVYWNDDTEHSVYTLYACNKVSHQGFVDGVVQILLQDDARETSIPIRLISGARAYVMNDRGRTIDTIWGGFPLLEK